VLTGYLFGTLMLLLFITIYYLLVNTNNIKYYLLFLITSFTLVFIHSYTSFIIMIFFIISYLLCKIEYVEKIFKMRKYIKIKLMFVIIMLEILYSSYIKINLTKTGWGILQQWIASINQLIYVRRTYAGTAQLSKFIQLSLINKIKILLVNYGGDLFLLFFTFIGIIIILMKFKETKYYNFISMFILFLWAFFITQLIMTSGKTALFEYNRVIYYSSIFSPIIFGIFLYYIHKKFNSYKLSLIILSIFILFASIELYGYQPLIPFSNEVRKGLPSDEYIVYIGVVNSIYQRNVITFAEEYIKAGIIVSDRISFNQFLGLTNQNFSNNHLLRYYPFTILYDNSTKKVKYDYVIIHLPGRSGKLEVKPEIGTKKFILNATIRTSILYSNTESFILTYPFMYEKLSIDETL
ncbi:MAG: hypothetical protein ACFFDN_06605, partial [Candidatus Hodarchaeota archaeon]